MPWHPPWNGWNIFYKMFEVLPFAAAFCPNNDHASSRPAHWLSKAGCSASGMSPMPFGAIAPVVSPVRPAKRTGRLLFPKIHLFGPLTCAGLVKEFKDICCNQSAGFDRMMPGCLWKESGIRILLLTGLPHLIAA